jgi:hypothetical protein
VYCIYTDAEVPQECGNYDHVYPLSLGGTNQFTIWSDIEKNSLIGSEVDGKLVNDPLLGPALQESGVRGHGRKAHVPRWRNTTMDDGRPVQVTLGKEKITVWDARQRRDLEENDVVGRQMTTRLQVGKHTALRFLAKAALGGGYFIYGDAFRNAVNCDDLREIVFLDVEQSRTKGRLQHSKISVCDRFHPDSIGNGPGVIYRALCEGTKRSLFISIPHHDSISFHVGVVGYFIGSIIIPASTNGLPIDGEHDLGHAIVLGPGTMERLPFRELVLDFKRAMDEAKQAAGPS